jgi:hypothetical protein
MYVDKPIKINVVTYRLNAKSDEYKTLAAELKARGLHHFNVWHTRNDKELAPGVYTAETEHLFSDQTNTVEGWRVFDWYDGMPNTDNRDYRVGHYIADDDGFKTLQELRRNTNVCGYCGRKQPAANGAVFCDKCLDSEYLTEKDLPLLRLMPVAEFMPKRPPLTAAEYAHLQPLWLHAQVHGNTERGRLRIAKRQADIVKERDAAIRNANTEHDGLKWLLDNGINTDNVIYYKHTGPLVSAGVGRYPIANAARYLIRYRNLAGRMISNATTDGR